MNDPYDLRSWNKHYRRLYERHGWATSCIRQERTAGHAQRSRDAGPPGLASSPLLSVSLNTPELR
jgi:hypothetical protein